MTFLGKNYQGEAVYADAAGGRYLVRAGETIASLSPSTQFQPYNPASNNRFKTVLEVVEGICRQHDHDIDGIGAAAAVRAMARHWDSHLREEHSPAIVLTDVNSMKERVDHILEDLSLALNIAAA